MRGRYDPIKRFEAIRKTNWRYSQKRTRRREKEKEEEDSVGEKSAIRFTRVDSRLGMNGAS